MKEYSVEKGFQFLQLCFFLCFAGQWRTQEKISGGGGVQGRGSGLVGGPGGGAPRTPENFRNFAKKFLKKIAKNFVFSPILQKNFKTMR